MNVLRICIIIHFQFGSETNLVTKVFDLSRGMAPGHDSVEP